MKMNNEIQLQQAPTKAFRISAIAALCIGAFTYMVGLVNADMALNEKGYYLIVILFGLFASVSVQKSVRDKAEGIKTSSIYVLLAWIATASAVSLLCIGLYNADLLLSEKGFFGIAFLLSLFAAITVQKNVRDVQAIKDNENLLATGTVRQSKPTKSAREKSVQASTDKDQGTSVI
jgi:uncharacterized membrane protein YiaA